MKKLSFTKIFIGTMSFFFISVIVGGIFVFSNSKPKYNVIFLVVDALRADHMSLYGYFRNTTPNIDKFAKEAVVFENAFTAGSWTFPASVSLFGSRYVTSIYFSTGPYEGENFNDYFPVSIRVLNTLTDILNRKGFATKLITSEAIVVKMLDLRFTEKKIFDRTKNWNEEMMYQEACSWLEKHKDKRFFLTMWYMSIHEPYNFPEKFDIFSRKDLPKYKEIPLMFPVALLNEKELENTRAVYDGGILYVDDCIKNLLKKIEELGLDKNTIIVITADHGEELAEHVDFFHHLWSGYQGVCHIPLIIKYPGLSEPKRIKEWVSNIDIAPTILDILHLPIPKEFAGKSLLPLIKGTEKRKGPIFHVIGPNFDGSYIGFAVFDYPYKLISYIPGSKLVNDLLIFIGEKDIEKDKLFNLNKDPKEKRNLIEEEPQKARELKEILKRFLFEETKKFEKLKPKIEKEIPKEKMTEEEKKEMLKILKDLGYL